MVQVSNSCPVWIRYIASVAIIISLTEKGLTEEPNWGQWRGPSGTGVAVDADPPTEWSEDKNIRWKVEVPGEGHSTPVIWGDRIFLTTAIPHGEKLAPKYSGAPGAHDNRAITQRQKYVALAINRHNGKTLWEKILQDNLPHEGGHQTASLASNSPVTDGKHVFAYFGSQGLFCLDMEGRVQWQVTLGVQQTKHGHGEGSSPALYQSKLIVNWDHEGQSFLLALDKSTGREIWRVDREEVTSWATPIVFEHAGIPQVIVAGTERVRGYDLNSGQVIWECGGMSANIVASPVAADGMVYVGSSYEKRALLAISLDGARGDITDSKHIVWNRFRGTPYVPSPLLYDDALYFHTHYQNILTRVLARSGEDQPGALRLSGIRNVYASPVAAAGRVYITDLDGNTLVFQHGPVPRMLAYNQLDESFSASAAIVEECLYLRGQKHLYSLAAEAP